MSIAETFFAAKLGGTYPAAKLMKCSPLGILLARKLVPQDQGGAKVGTAKVGTAKVE